MSQTNKSWLHAYCNAHSAAENCRRRNNLQWKAVHEAVCAKLVQMLPSGSGFDKGTEIQQVRTTGNQMIEFSTSFHHMDDNGSYLRWTVHSVYVRPSFDGGARITISGENYRNIKEYIHEVFESLLTSKVRVNIADVETAQVLVGVMP